MILPPAHILEFFPEYRSTQTPWQALTPLAAWIVHDLHPARIVELGSYRGDSFFAFLQAAASEPRVLDLVAIDSWEGDQHTGQYGKTVHQQFMAELKMRNDPRARAIQSFFNEAAVRFEEASIDLLHIDGAHDHESVKQDFETWLPKMQPDGVVLFHDTMVRTDDFGVWQVWNELERRYPGRTFNFEHSNGLGVLCLGDSDEGQIRALCRLDQLNQNLTRDALRLVGQRVRDMTDFESSFILRNGSTIALDHEFSRGEARIAMEVLYRTEALRRGNDIGQAMNDRIEHLFRNQANDVFSAIQPMIEVQMDHYQGGGRADMLAAAAGQTEARIGRLLRDQTGDVFSALRPILDKYVAEMANIMLQNALEELRNQMQVKNNAQDDTLIAFGEKIDAHEFGIQELASYLRQVLQHPFIRS